MMVRLPLATGSGGARESGDSLKYSPRRKPETNALEYSPPGERLAAAISECFQLDRELKVLENSGHARIGVFAKPLVNNHGLKATAASNSQHEEGRDDSTLLDEECGDPFYHQFYDGDGRSMFEQLLRCRMRVLVLTKMVYGRVSLQYIRAEIELAETYARLNLWKQGHIHILTANELLKTIDAKVDAQDAEMAINGHRGSKSLLLNVLEHSYGAQADDAKKGHVTLQELADVIQSWKDSSNNKIDRTMIPFGEKSLASVFGSTSTLHWQQLILQLERHSALYQGYMARIESKVPVSSLNILRNTFSSLDLSLDGVVPFHTFLLRLEHVRNQDLYLQKLCLSLQTLLDRLRYHSITWSELLELGRTRQFYDDAAQALRPRLKLFMSRLFLRRGQLDDAVRQVQLAIAEQEQLVGTESVALVQYYLVIAEAMAVRFKQIGVVAQQSALESTDAWLQSTEGSRALRVKAIDLIDEECTRTNTMLTKKDAEMRARELLVQEYAATSLMPPDPAMIEDAIEFCTKAWSLQESHFGREHITTAIVHVTLAQIYLVKKELGESIRHFTKAIEIYEQACHGPVPASSFLRLEIARLYQQQRDVQKTREMYMEVGSFFHSFSQEFAGCDTTRRECCAQAMDAFRHCLAVSPHWSQEEQKQVHLKIYQTVIDGFGECSMEASESAKELGNLLVDMGNLKGAEKYLKTACYIVESHFGPNDRRYRRLRKEVLDVSAQLKSSTLHPNEGGGHDGHAWLNI